MMAGRDQITDDGEWHLDKRVPIALMLSLALHAGATLWWASQLTERVGALERQQISAAPQGDRLTRVEVKLENVQSGIDEIKRLVRRDTPG
jgi:hypothetical protein